MTKHRVENIYIIACMLVLSFVAYMCFTQNMPTRKPDEQAQLYSEVPTAIPGPPPVAAPVANDKALMYMEIPRFGKDWFWTVLEGTDLSVLDRGPGHFTGTELPGQEGNSAYAAHRASHGDPFLDFETLEIGDEVIVSQSGAKWVYKITTTPEIISENAGWVLDDFAPGKWMTLTTCWPKYGSEKRMFVRAELDRTIT